MTMKAFLKLTIVVFAAGLGAMVAYRMSAEAIAVIVGVVFGVLASVPAGLIFLAVARRMERAAQPPPEPAMRQYPPVVIVSGGEARSLMPGAYGGRSEYGFPALPAREESEFVVVDEDG